MVSLVMLPRRAVPEEENRFPFTTYFSTRSLWRPTNQYSVTPQPRAVQEVFDGVPTQHPVDSDTQFGARSKFCNRGKSS